PYSHSMSDDETKYKRKAEREAEAERDCLTTFARFLVEEGILQPAELDRLQREIDESLRRAAEEAIGSPQPATETATLHLFSPEVDPARWSRSSSSTTSGPP